MSHRSIQFDIPLPVDLTFRLIKNAVRKIGQWEPIEFNEFTYLLRWKKKTHADFKAQLKSVLDPISECETHVFFEVTIPLQLWDIFNNREIIIKEFVGAIDNELKTGQYKNEEKGSSNHSQGRCKNDTEEEDLEKRFAETLGLGGLFTEQELKNNYKKRISEYHPDKVAHLGPKLKNIAEEESKKLNEAYEYFKKKYNFQ